MAERETETGPGREPSAVAWVGKWLQSDAAAPGPAPAGEPLTRSLGGDASTGVRTTALTVAPVRFGGYEITGKIGQGGMGAVHKARHLELDRVVALKLISPRSWDDSVARTRFEREFRALARIDHPNIVPVYDAGTWDGVPYFTMRYVPGGALSKHLDRFRADPAAAARLTGKVARAVHHLHQAGVLHRDLKPHNILLGDGDEPLVADFGLVKDLGEDSEASVTGAPMGTRQYMSPEQTFGHKSDYAPACDIWAIGVILYELLTGARPFPSSDPVEVYLQIRGTDPKPVAELNPAAPAPLAAVALRCLAKAPGDRYPTAAAVAADLEAWLAGDAVTATPAPPRRRRPARMYAAGGVLTAAVVAAVALGWPTPRPDATPPPPAAEDASPEGIAKRFRAGRVVTLIGPTGAPAVPPEVVKASGGELSTRVDGFCTFSSHGLAALVLTTDAAPPYRLTAEVGLIHSRMNTSTAGVFVGRRAGAGPPGWQAWVEATLIDRLDGPGAPPSDEVRLARRWRPDAGGGVTSQHDRLALAQGDRGTAARWHRFDLVVLPGEVRVACDGRPLDPMPVAAFGDFVAREARARRPASDPAPPAFGPGVGLTLFDAEAVYRNVTLTPLTPTPET